MLRYFRCISGLLARWGCVGLACDWLQQDSLQQDGGVPGWLLVGCSRRLLDRTEGAVGPVAKAKVILAT